jgi:hypothetical protein
MKQAEFSELVKNYIAQHHPEFMESMKFQKDGSFDCSVKSKKDIISLWIATYDAEISVGLEDRDFLTDWHIRMRAQGAKNPQQELERMTVLVNKILSDGLEIEYTEDTGFEVGEYNEDEEVYDVGDSDFIKIYKWSDL